LNELSYVWQITLGTVIVHSGPVNATLACKSDDYWLGLWRGIIMKFWVKRRGVGIAALCIVAIMGVAIASQAVDQEVMSDDPDGPYVVSQTPAQHELGIYTYAGAHGGESLIVGGTDYSDVPLAFIEKWAEHEGGSQSRDFNVNLKVTGNAIASVVPTITVLALDYSLSMNAYDMDGNDTFIDANRRITLLKAAIRGFIDAMSDNDYLAIVTYNRYAYLTQEFLPMTADNKTIAKASLNKQPSTVANTNVQAAIHAAIKLFEDPVNYAVSGQSAVGLGQAVGDAATRYNFVFMSDGVPNTRYRLNSLDGVASWSPTVLSDLDFRGQDMRLRTANDNNVEGFYELSDPIGKSEALNAANLLKSFITASSKNISAFSVGFASGTSNYIDEAVLNAASSNGSYVSANDYSPMELFDEVRGMILATIRDSVVTDIFPPGFVVKAGEISVFTGQTGTAEVRYDGASVSVSEDAGGGIVVVTGLPDRGADVFYRISIPVVAPMTGDDPPAFDTNVSAQLAFTNELNPGSDPFGIIFAVPQIHVPYMEDVEEPGTTNPEEPGTTNPEEPGTTNPEEPGTTNPEEPDTTTVTEEPDTTTGTDEPGTTAPVTGGETETVPVDPPEDGVDVPPVEQPEDEVATTTPADLPVWVDPEPPAPDPGSSAGSIDPNSEPPTTAPVSVPTTQPSTILQEETTGSSSQGGDAYSPVDVPNTAPFDEQAETTLPYDDELYDSEGFGVDGAYEPGGSDPNMPPMPFVFGNEIVPGGPGEFIELSDSGLPYGSWTFDDDAGVWVFEEYPTPGGVALPKTGDESTSVGYSALGIMLIFIVGLVLIGSGAYMSEHGRK
jgi:LPXTG-motif cell wall-anchored protein